MRLTHFADDGSRENEIQQELATNAKRFSAKKASFVYMHERNRKDIAACLNIRFTSTSEFEITVSLKAPPTEFGSPTIHASMSIGLAEQ